MITSTSIPELPARITDITQAQLRCVLPGLHYYERSDEEPVAAIKFFTPDSNWTWYAQEFDGEDTFFGLVQGFEIEYGYFSLRELQAVTGPFGLHIERDILFRPCTMDSVYEWLKEGDNIL